MKNVKFIIIFTIISVLYCGTSFARISFATMESAAAMVAGTEITLDKFERAVKFALDSDDISLEADQEIEVKRSVLNQLIDDVLIERGAQIEGIVVTEKEIRSEIEILKKRFPSSAEFHRSIAEQNMTIADLQLNIQRQLVVKKLQDLLMDRIFVSDEEIKNFYERNMEVFVKPKAVSVQQILVLDKSLAESLRASLEADVNFGDLAKKYSQDDQSRENGGNIGFVGIGELLPEVENFAFCAISNEASPVIETDDGCYIVRVNSRVKGKETSLNLAKNNISEFLLKEKGFKAFSRWLDYQRLITDIVVNKAFEEFMIYDYVPDDSDLSVIRSLS